MTTLSPEIKSALKQMLVLHEGKRNFPYPDTEGNITIGIGYNLTARGLPDSWINSQYEADVDYFYSSLCSDYPWYRKLSDNRKMVLIDMCFMGYRKFQGFVDMIAALSVGNYKKAAEEMMDSQWAMEVKGRADQLSELMIEG